MLIEASIYIFISFLISSCLELAKYLVTSVKNDLVNSAKNDSNDPKLVMLPFLLIFRENGNTEWEFWQKVNGRSWKRTKLKSQ